MGLRLFERRRVRSAGDRKRLGRFLLHDFTGGRHRGNQQSRYPDATRRIYPGYGKLRLEISSGIGTVASYDVMSDYDQPLLQAGDYQADFSYGNPDTEGENAGCFKGTKQFTVVARKTTTEQVSLSLVNSVYSLSCSEWFRQYYTDYDLTVRTESGFRSGFSGSTAKPLTGTLPVFVKAATKLFLSGSATKTNGVKVEFPETEIGTTAARTWHTILLDAGAVGQASITVSLDDSPIEIKEVDVELNPDA
ncbi:MAG: DUF4493 domain-containing protein [Alistipes sp.]